MKKIILGAIFASSLFALGSLAYGEMGHHHNTRFGNNNIEEKFQKKLLLPPMMKGEIKDGVRTFKLEATKGEWEFLTGRKSETYGYNGPILGPVLSMNKGEKVRIDIKNSLDEETTVHWHGGILSQDVDGVHDADIQPQAIKSVEFTLNQPAATLWFHPHPMHKTAGQVYKGLAGLIYLNDEASSQLEIPKSYGIDDFPLVIQDKKLGNNGELTYSTTKMEKIHGKAGGYLMINGIISPYIEVPNGLVRLRIVNGSNASNFNIDLQGEEFYQIASDGGFLSETIAMNSLLLAPGERAEILVNTEKLSEQSYIYVNGSRAMELRKNGTEGLKKIPKNLVEIPEITQNLSELTTRKFKLKTTGRGNTINNTPYDMDKLNFSVQKGTQEIWEITNGSAMMDMPHPFHVHGAQFRVIERNGQIPPLNEQGYKDTVNLKAGETVKILINYTTDGVTVYHCHILEHEEDGMMGQFEIE